MLFTMFVLFLFGLAVFPFHRAGTAPDLVRSQSDCRATVCGSAAGAAGLPVCGGRPIAAGPAGADRRCFRHFEILRLTCYLSSYYYAHEAGTQKHKGEIEL